MARSYNMERSFARLARNTRYDHYNLARSRCSAHSVNMARFYGMGHSDRIGSLGNNQVLFLRLARYNLVVLTGLTAHSDDPILLGLLDRSITLALSMSSGSLYV